MSTLLTTVPGAKTAGQTTYKYTPYVKFSDENVVVLLSASTSFALQTNSDGVVSISSSNTGRATVTYDSNTKMIKVTAVAAGSCDIIVKIAPTDTYFGAETKVGVIVRSSAAVRYGYRIAKNNSDPDTRVEYLYDAVGFTPAKMDFTNDVFSYGSWGNVWFVTDNKPLMLKSNGTVDYYLNPNDYTLKADGTTASDVSNAEYDGNAMAQFPLCWVKRWEDSNYEYEVVSNVQYDADYKAYAHTNAKGEIINYFYWSLFGGSLISGKMRSLKDQTRMHTQNAQNEINYARANNPDNTGLVYGDGWYTHTWSQHELIRTLCILLSKTTNSQAAFGNGNAHSAPQFAGHVLTTGTLSDKGQFYGSTDNTKQVKVFHVEAFWGDQWDRVAGVINNKGPIYVKMTPEGDGYRVTDVNGYTNTGIVISGTNGGFISGETCSEFGMIPNRVSGSDTTYYCDRCWFNNGILDYLILGAGAYSDPANAGVFTFDVHNAPSAAWWNYGAAISYCH